MAKNVFDKIGDIKNNVDRSTFDWSHSNNFTTGFGRITPVLCELCPPASSLKIKPDYGLQFMPLMYPVQTKMKSYLSFFRVPLRTLWKDYMDFISGVPGTTYEPPYIKFPASSFTEGGALGVSSLADYLGIPVTSPNASSNMANLDVKTKVESNVMQEFQSGVGAKFITNFPAVYNPFEFTAIDGAPYRQDYVGKTAWIPLSEPMFQTQGGLGAVSITDTFPTINANEFFTTNLKFRIRCKGYGVRFLRDNLREHPDAFKMACIVRPKKGASGFPEPYKNIKGEAWNLISSCDAKIVDSFIGAQQSASDYLDLEFELPAVYRFEALEFIPNQDYASTTNDKEWWRTRFMIGLDYSQVYFDDGFFTNNCLNFGVDFIPDDVTSSSVSMTISPAPLNVTVIDKNTCPYFFDGCDESKNPLKLSAYPFRAYEAIYNAYIRNTRNNPFMLDGKPVYNRWITNDAGGADDTTPLDLRRANWASDAFTTALTAPQQGKAPLVGITTYADTHVDDNGHSVTDMKFALVDEDGKKYGLTFVSNDTELKDVQYTELSSNQPVSPISSLFDLATSGISINDFRNVNAYQRYLELNQFRGFSYKEIIEGRFDVNVKYDALNMPEYLGGITRDVIVNPVTQNVETSNAGTYSGALGSQAGIAGVRGNSDGSISVYCDEESLIIGIVSVVPMPVYTQTLPKHFLYRDRLDSYNPEFDHIGYQPIGLSELCPVLDFVQNGKNTNATFGYQRPWYEYVQKRDTAHGIFRTELRNFLINRVFDGVPQLGEEFTTVDENTVNQVFSVTETTDKIFGQIYFDITAKLPISRVVVPKLE